MKIPDWNMLKQIVSLTVGLQWLFLALVLGINYLTDEVDGFDLTIVHNNDVHAHFDEIDQYYGECSPDEEKAHQCYGGEARRNWFIQGSCLPLSHIFFV